MIRNVKTSSRRIFVGKLAGTPVFDPLGDPVGRVYDVVLLMRFKGNPRCIGLVVEVSSLRRVFLPLSRVTAIQPGAVITTGLLNIRRFTQRAVETLCVSEVFDRIVTLNDGSGQASIQDVCIEPTADRDWEVTELFVERIVSGTLGFRRAGETIFVSPDQVTGLRKSKLPQDATALLATFEDAKPADIADVLHDLRDERMLEVSAALDNETLADVLEELGEDDRVQILTSLPVRRAADILDVMQPDDAADLVNELPDQKAAVLLELMEPEEAEDVRRLMVYDENTAGGLMTTEAVVLPPDANVAELLASVRRQDIPPAVAAMVCVTRPPLETPTGKFLGVVHIQRALREPPQTPLGTITDTDIEPLQPEANIGTITRLLATYNLTALPVTDAAGRLLGLVSVDDVLDHLLPEDWRNTDEDVTDATVTRSANG